MRQRGQPGCWQVDWTTDWFDWIAHTPNCQQPWGNNLNAPTVFGFKESMVDVCHQHGGYGGDPGGACMSAHLNILRLAPQDWNVCRNVEWMHCVVQRQGCWGGGCTSEIIFTYSPRELDIEDFNSRPGYYIENDICAQSGLDRTRGHTVHCSGSHPPSRESRHTHRARVRGRRATDYLEVCVLNEMCGNHDEIFRVGHGGSFFCAFDAARWAAFGRVLQTM